MGLFDKVFSQGNKVKDQESVQAGFVQLCIAAAGADGYIDNDEWRSIVTYISRLKMFSDIKDSDINKLFEKALGVLERKGSLELLKMGASQIPQELSNTAFACITDILLSDGILESEEEQVLENAYSALNIEENMATTIIEVMLIKNKM